MRCDDNVNGCAPCSQNHSECKTTDRITGKATVRGYLQSIERRNQELENYIHLLQSRLASLGDNLEGVRLDDKCAEPATSPLLAWHDDQTLGTRQAWDCFAQETRMPSHGPEGFLRNMINGGTSDEPESRLPYFRDGLAGNNYLGVSTGNSLLSSIRGTSMNVLGMEIDLADYMSPDLDEPDPARPGTQPVYNKSYRAFVQTAFGISPKLAKVELPPKCEGMEYAKVYFRVTNPYLPIVHKPSFMATVSSMNKTASGFTRSLLT